MKTCRMFAILLGLCAGQASAAERLSYVDLVSRLTDLERLALLPSPGEKCAQFSSYDRKSRYDEVTGKYLDWEANNNDGDSIIRQENGKSVLAEMSGPGVIWRIWSARPEQGHVRIYLDGAATPAVDLPFIGFFDRQHEPFTYPVLVHEVASGMNNYVPIPYQSSCKIVADKGWGEFYHFDYTTYPKGTVLPTFSMQLSAQEKAALAKADTVLAKCGGDPAGIRPGEITEDSAHTVAPEATEKILEIKGSAAITAIKVKVDLPGPVQAKNSPGGLLRIQREILRGLTLRITWDGESSPSVYAPLGDFFGTPAGASKYRSLPLGLTDDGFYCYWYMPFAKSGLVELSNRTETARTVRFAITHAPLRTSVEELGRFHAYWHGDADLPDDAERRAIDWTILKTQGRGRFVGVSLHVWNPGGGWWGEGDEKFYIDGEKFPSTIGTGSEDYFGFAWCNPTEFQHAYHNQPRNPNNRGHIAVNRWHISENLPFQSSFEGAIEKFFPNERPTLYDCVAYFYQTQPHKAWQVEGPFAGAPGKYLRLYQFVEDAKAYSASSAIEPLRAVYKDLVGDVDLVRHIDKATLAMARIEKTAGHAERSDALLKPVIETLTVPFMIRDVAGEFRDLLPQPASGNHQNVLLVTEQVTDREGDGSIKRLMKEGRWCIATQCDARRFYVYFALASGSPLRNRDGTVRMSITYYYEGDNVPSVQYDSFFSQTSEAYYHNADSLAAPPAKGWHTAVVSCPRARLSGHQNGESDFRIAAPDNHDIYIAEVAVE